MTPWDTYDSTPPRGTALEWTRVYRSGGRMAHLRPENGSVIIACDDAAYPKMPAGRDDRWLGTGSQGEYDYAASLPLCTKCFSVKEAARIGISADQTDPEERERPAP